MMKLFLGNNLELAELLINGMYARNNQGATFQSKSYS